MSVTEMAEAGADYIVGAHKNGESKACFSKNYTIFSSACQKDSNCALIVNVSEAGSPICPGCGERAM